MFYQHFYKLFFRGEEQATIKHVETQKRKARLADQYLRDNGIDMNQINSVLDVGCSAGGMLDYFRSCGVLNLTGIEPSTNYAEFARNELDLEVYATTLEDFLDEPVDQKFDLVIMRDIVEHLLDPKKVLNELPRVMHDESILFIETNNVFKSLNPTLKYSYQFHYAHPYIFSVNSLRNILNISGYKVINIVDDRYISCIATLEKGINKSITKDSYESVIKHIKRHDRYLWFTNIIFKLRVKISSLRVKFGLIKKSEGRK